MTVARSQIVDSSTSGIYHCVSRCVRRAYLLDGGDSRRRSWMHDRMRFLSEIFAIDFMSFAILTNHFHCILRTHPERVADWSGEEVVSRWIRLHPASVRNRAVLRGAAPSLLDLEDDEAIRVLGADEAYVDSLRPRLASLSELMKNLKQRIARRANQEDGCTGHFWEGRYKSYRILDERALLAAMVYVDLNVIRAARADTPESSEYTSAWDRIQVRKLYHKQQERSRRASSTIPRLLRSPVAGNPEAELRSAEDRIWLAPISRAVHADGLFEMSLDQYLSLLDASGRVIRAGKAGAIPSDLAPILERLAIDAHAWTRAISRTGKRYGTVIGSAAHCAAEAARRCMSRVVSAAPDVGLAPAG